MASGKVTALPVRFSVLLSQAEHAALDALAEHAGLNVEAYFRVLIRNQLRKVGPIIMFDEPRPPTPPEVKELQAGDLWRIQLPEDTFGKARVYDWRRPWAKPTITADGRIVEPPRKKRAAKRKPASVTRLPRRGGHA